jgi:hypothetical protein
MSKLGILAAESYLTKIGFGPDAADKVLKLVKTKQLRLANPGQGYFTLPKRSIFSTPISKHYAKFNLKPAMLDTLQTATDAVKPQISPYVQKNTATFITPHRSDAQKFFRELSVHLTKHPAGFPAEIATGVALGKRLDKIKTPAQRKMLEAVTKGHELAESQVALNPNMIGWNHNSPDVILREHNMITTMPKRMGPVRTLFKTLRKTREAAAWKEVFPQFTFGVGPRVSRHARKRMLEEYTRVVQEHRAP